MTSIRIPDGMVLTEQDLAAIAALLGIEVHRLALGDDSSPGGSWVYDRADDTLGPAVTLKAGVVGFPLGTRWRGALDA